MNVNDVVKGVTALKKLNGIDLPINLSLQIMKNTILCQDVLDILNVKRETIKDDTEKIIKLLEEEVDLDIKFISIKELMAAEVKLSATDLANLEWMLKEDA